MLSALISDVATLEPIEIGQNLLTLPLSQATRVTRTQFESLTQQLKELDKTIDALQQGKTKIALLEQTIRHAGKELVALNPELDHCPLCRSPFNKNELARRINSGTNEKTESAFAPLQKRKGDLTALCAKTRDELTALNALSEFVQGGNFEAETVKGAIGHLVKSRKQLVSEQEELRKLKKRLTALEDNGLTENDLRKCKNDAAIKGALPQIDAIKQLSDTLNTTLSEQKNAKQVLKGALKTLGDESTDLATKHGITATMDVDELAKAFNEQMTDIERALKATAELQFIFKYDATMAAAELTVKLEQLQSLVVKLRTAIAQEQKADAEIEVVTKTIAGIDAKLKDLESKLGRAKMAQKDFSALQRDHSGEALKTKILHENCEEIERIFSSIHSPSEFSLTDGNQSLQIIRRESNEKVGLHEMSTGQRAAYALSLFLSMNARLQEGPKVLIFDDPIAHIDDINILSFLDYLRDLALTEKRQIFFATADAKLAGIFRHKFRFLGEGKFLEIKLKYEE